MIVENSMLEFVVQICSNMYCCQIDNHIYYVIIKHKKKMFAVDRLIQQVLYGTIFMHLKEQLKSDTFLNW